MSTPLEVMATDCTSRTTCLAALPVVARMWTSTRCPVSSATIRAARTSGMRQSSRSTAAMSTNGRVPPPLSALRSEDSPTASEGQQLGGGAARRRHGLEIDADGGLAELVTGGDGVTDDRPARHQLEQRGGGPPAV